MPDERVDVQPSAFTGVVDRGDQLSFSPFLIPDLGMTDSPRKTNHPKKTKVNTIVKRIAQIGLCMVSLGFAQLAMAQAGTVFELTGTAQAATGMGPARVLKQGDTVNQGDTLSTGASSLLIVRFADGQVASLVSNSKLTIDAYTYDPADPAKGQVQLSLQEGGMRTATGLIGKARPQAVSYKAAGATIGIKGTDIIVMTNDGNVILQVLGGVATLIVDGMVRVVSLGQAGIMTKDHKVTGVNAEQLSQTLQQLFPNNTNIQATAKDLNNAAAKIDGVQMAQTGTTVINVQTRTTNKIDPTQNVSGSTTVPTPKK